MSNQKKSLSEIKKLNRLSGGNNKLSEILGQFDDIQKQLISDKEFNNELYFHKLKAEIHEIDAEQAKNAFEAYFCGENPLTNPKNREDIPDSFICQSIVSIFKKYSNLDKKFIIIANDKKILTTFKEDERFTVYESLNLFFQSKDIEKYLKDIYFEFKNSPMDFFVKYKQEDITNNLSLFSDLDNCIFGKNLDDFPYSNDGTALIVETMGLYDFDVDFDNPITLNKNENKISFYFSAEGYSTVEFYINKSDFYSYFDNELEVIDDVNDYVYLVRGEFDINIVGLFSIEIDFNDEFINEVKNNSANLAEYLSDKEFEMVFNIENIDEITLKN